MSLQLRCCYLLTILIILSTTFSLGDFYRPIASLLCILSLHYCIKVFFLNIKKPRYIISLVVFCFIYTIYTIGSVPITNEIISKWGMLLWMLPVQLSFFPSYYFTIKGKLDEKSLIKLFKVLFGASLLCFLGNYYKLMNNPLWYASDGYTNNMGYLVLILLPYTFLLKSRISTAYMIVIFALVFFSMKRGAILILLLSYFIYQFISNRKAFRKLLASFLVSFVLIVGVFGLMYNIYFSGNEYFERRMEQTINMDTSGRDGFAKLFFSEISKWDDISLLFGKGVNYSMKVLNNFAHNDWLELFFTMGTCGILVYIFYYKSLLSSRKYCSNSIDKNLILIIVFIMLLQTLISMLFFDQSLFYHNILLGYILGKQKLCVRNI